MKQATIALIGNPNCGKTTLFNALTGGNIKTGNWPGVTVEKREGTIKKNEEVTVVDLPGIYSFSAHSEDEIIARNYVLSGEPSLILNILDSTNLERNLYLTTQLIEMKIPMIVVLNMYDLAKKQKTVIDIQQLSKKLSIPVIAVSAIEKESVENLKSEIIKNIDQPLISNLAIHYPNELEAVIAEWNNAVQGNARELSLDARWISIKLLENDSYISDKVIKTNSLSKEEIHKRQNSIEAILGETPDIICADYRYGIIHSICREVIKRATLSTSLTDKIDKLVLNRILGIPIFLFILYLVFWTTITVGGAFIDFFDIAFGTIFVDGFGAILSALNAPEWLTLLLAGGIGGGVQTVATFIPIIFMMFLMLGILEDSGYMARAAFVMDKFMRVLGLPGKSFVPLLVGFGCTVPAILATRTLENKKDRYMTIFMAPFMSCGARLPVYALFTVAFFPASSGLVVFSIYMAGLLFAVLTGLLLKNSLFKGEPSYFVMELPSYHKPRIRHILLHTWDRMSNFVFKAGKVIILVVLVLSLLNSLGKDGSIGNEDSNNSVLSTIGKTITPVFEPMGIEKENWPATVGLFTGIFAKEAVVGTLNSLYSQIENFESADVLTNEEDAEDDSFDLAGGLKEAFLTIPAGLGEIFSSLTDPLGLAITQETDPDSLSEELEIDTTIFGSMNRYFSKGKWQAYAYLLFILLYFPCVAAFGAVAKEIGTAFAVLSAVYLTVLAWVVAVLFYQFTTGHEIFWILSSIALLVVTILILLQLKKIKRFQISGLVK